MPKHPSTLDSLGLGPSDAVDEVEVEDGALGGVVGALVARVDLDTEGELVTAAGTVFRRPVPPHHHPAPTLPHLHLHHG